jgi:exonuclease SbcC
MHITKIELEDIKSYADSTFEFSPGTTAITGENGAGKTTLIEAVAWTLFDLLDYKKDDFVRRGAKRGVARVTFESGLDERLYTVYRDTGAGYYVYDPAIKTRIADKKEEVTRFLWQHLGVEAGTDLESLFRRAIGVPQGTFTAIFLESATDRKKAFDKLLKVEEYRRGADELLKTSRFVEQQIQSVSVNIARAEGELSRIEIVEEEHKNLAKQAAALEKELTHSDEIVSQKLASVAEFDVRENKLDLVKASRDTLHAESSRAEIVLRHAESGVEQARLAAEKIKVATPDAEKYAAAVARLRELERERVERDKLRAELSKTEAAIAAVKAEQKHAQERLENALNAHKTIEQLREPLSEQERLEKEREVLRDRLAKAKAVGDQVKSLDEKIERLRENYRSNQAQLTEARAKTADLQNLDGLQKRDAEIVREVAALNASLERDEKFQREIKNGLCPVLSQKCLNLKEGETLDGFVTSQFEELKTAIATLEGEHGKVAQALQISREAEKYSAQIATLESREVEIRDEGKRLSDELEKLQKGADDLRKIEAEFSGVDNRLKALDDPKGKIRMLENEVRREGEFRQEISKIEKNLERLESDRRICVEKLESYKDMDSQIAQAAEIRDKTDEAHRTVLANEAIAKTLGERARELETAKNEIAQVRQKLAGEEEALALAVSEYDRESHAKERAELLELQKSHAEMRATFEAAKRRADQLDAELKRLAETRKAMQAEFKEKERLEKVSEATDFIRATLKEAAPLVARNYVYHVSQEANQMFREITGNAERTLKWAEDYGILLEEGGYDRPFTNLSGGEQMAAALSVRLALLKQLSDIRIAFFDEPTTNMDAERRENFAMQISRIGYFDQLFVISHDDTFESYVDNVVTIEKT